MMYVVAVATTCDALVPLVPCKRCVRTWGTDEDLEEEFQARVEELGGKTGVQARAATSAFRRDVRSLKEFLDLEPTKTYPPGSAKDTEDRLQRSGWTITVGLLGLCVLLACLQAFRIDPSNYT